MSFSRVPTKASAFSTSLFGVFVAAVTLLGTVRSDGATLYWKGGPDAWDTTSAFWTLDSSLIAPFQAWTNASFDTAVFSGTAGTVTLGEAISAGSLTFSTTGYTVTGNTLTLSAAGSIDTGTGTQTIASVIAGAVTSLTKSGTGSLVFTGANTYIGSTTVAAGTLTVRGSGASIGVAGASASTMSVGSTADGSLTIENGAVVKNTAATLGSASGTTGSVTVDGAGSLWNVTNTSGTTLSIASGGNGSLTVSNGGTFTSVRPASFTTTAGHTGNLLVDGVGSTFSSTNLNIQGAGTGTMTVSGGGKINSGSSSLGNSSGTGGTVTALVTGTGSQWNLNVGSTPSLTMYGGTALTIADAGTVNVGWSVYLGDTVGSVAKVTVGGNSATLNVPNAGFVVGDFGSGTLEVNAGGIVNAGYNFRLGNDTAAVGIVKQNGGTVTVTRYIEFFKGNAEYHLLGGTLIVGDEFSAGISTPSATTYLFELGGGTLQVKGDSNSSLTNNANMTLKSGTTSMLDTPSGGYQSMYLQGVVSGSGNLKITGPGIVVLNKASTYTGSTTIAGGTLRYGVTNALSISTNIIFNGGVLEFGVAPIALTAGTGGRQIQWIGDGGFSSYNGNRTISYESGAALAWGAINFVPDGHIFLLGSSILPSLGGTTTFNNAIDFSGGTRTIQVSDGSVAVDAILGGVLSNGAFNKTGAGTLSLTGANTYSGGTSVTGGLINFASLANLGTGSITLNGGGLQWATGNTTDISSHLASLGSSGATFDTNGNNVTLASDLSGTGSFTKSGSGILSLSGNNTYSGNTIISGGALRIGSSSALPATGNLQLNGGVIELSGTASSTFISGTGAGQLQWTGSGGFSAYGGDRTIDYTSGASLTWATSNFVASGNIFILSSAFSDSTTTFANAINLGGASRTVQVDNGTASIDAKLTGVLSNGGLTKTGAGTLVVSGDNTYTGTTAVSAGTLRATTAANALGTGSLTVSGTGALALANDTGLAFNRNTTVSASTTFTSDRLTSGAGVTHTLGTLSLGAQTLTVSAGTNVSSGTAGLTFGATSLTGNATFAPGAGTLITLASVTGTNRNLTVNGAGNMAVSGAITTGSGTLTKSGAGTLTLSGANTYTGITTVSASGGTLQFAKANSLLAANWTAAKLIVNSGATAAFNVGGSGEFTAANIATLSALGGASNGFRSGAILGLDTTNAGGSFSYTSGLSNPNSNANVLGLTKLGTGGLVLSGTNTYTGATSVNAGTLSVNGSLANTAVNVVTGGTLGGSGTIGGLTTISTGGHLAPGNSPGTLTFTNGLTLNTGAIIDFELGTSSDMIAVSGGALTGSSGTGGITLNLTDSGGFAAGDYTLFNFATGGTTTSSFDVADFVFGTTPNSTDFTYGLSFVGSTLVLNVAAIPEPATYAALFASAALSLVVCRRRRRTAQT